MDHLKINTGKLAKEGHVKLKTHEEQHFFGKHVECVVGINE
jgi:hypothetical protein